jgi:hypothetical protein
LGRAAAEKLIDQQTITPLEIARPALSPIVFCDKLPAASQHYPENMDRWKFHSDPGRRLIRLPFWSLIADDLTGVHVSQRGINS